MNSKRKIQAQDLFSPKIANIDPFFESKRNLFRYFTSCAQKKHSRCLLFKLNKKLLALFQLYMFIQSAISKVHKSKFTILVCKVSFFDPNYCFFYAKTFLFRDLIGDPGPQFRA